MDNCIKSANLTERKGLAFSGMAEKKTTLEIVVRHIKRRLRWVIRMSKEGTLAEAAKRLERAGCPTHETTIGRWLDEAETPLPDAARLAILLHETQEVSADYVLGRRPAVSDEEKTIERKVSTKPRVTR